MKKSSLKKYLPTILIVLVILIVVGFVVRALVSPDSQPAQTQTQTKGKVDITALKNGGSVGDPNSKVVITEFGDYQCPYCRVWHQYIKDTIIPQYSNKVLFVFKNYPLKMHKNAQAAAQAVESASLQGKFWEMHNMVYDHQADWSNSNDPNSVFEKYASQIGLNVDTWKKDRESDKVRNLIKNDVAIGDQLGLPGTPSFLINGVLQQPKSFEDFKNAIDQAISQSQ